MLLEIDGREVSVPFVGRFNVSNLLCVYGAAVMLGADRDEILRVMSGLRPVNGRFEAIRSPKGFSAVIDYAHTPDALANVLQAIHDVIGKNGRIITVCGAGGNRDKGKRPLMAQEAARQSDQVIITSDNPRFERPEDIIQDMLAGLDDEQRAKTLHITDRREAIRAAAAMARPGDVILVAGKGHEPYQEIEGVKHHSTITKKYAPPLAANQRPFLRLFSTFFPISSCFITFSCTRTIRDPRFCVVELHFLPFAPCTDSRSHHFHVVRRVFHQMDEAPQHR